MVILAGIKDDRRRQTTGLASARRTLTSASSPHTRLMSLPSLNVKSPARTSNVRLVVVDDNHQPKYLRRAARLEQAIIAAAGKHGVESEDMPGLHGLCVEAVRAAERHDH